MIKLSNYDQKINLQEFFKIIIEVLQTVNTLSTDIISGFVWKMSEHQENVIQHNKKIVHDNWAQIKTRLTVSKVIGTLIDENVITQSQWDEIQSKAKSDRDMCAKAIEFIVEKTPESLPIFHKALIKHGYGSLATLLDIQYDEKTSKNSCIFYINKSKIT